MPGFIDSSMVVHRGSVYSKSYENDGVVFIPPFAFTLASQNTAAWGFVQAATSQPAARLTANGAGAFQWELNLQEVFQKIGTDPILLTMPFPSGTVNYPGVVKLGAETVATDSDVHIIRGFQITSIDVAYSIATAALTSQTLTHKRNTFANNAAIVQTDPSGGFTATPALATATQANPYVSNLAPATPFVTGGNVTLTADYLEDSIVPLTTAVYTLYGAWIHFNYCIL